MIRGSYSFYQWCIDNDKRWLLDYWDYESNKCSPEAVAYQSNKKYVFWCGNEKHPKMEQTLCSLTSSYNKTTKESFCTGCKSVGEFILNKFNEDYLYNIWSTSNSCTPYEISAGSGKRIWLKCPNDDTHPDYDISAYNVKNTINCPYCAGKRLCKTNTLGFVFPESLNVWSDKNDKTPFEYTALSNQVVFCKCPAGKHEDFKRKICAHVLYEFRCPKCSIEKYFSGENNPRWNPDYHKNRNIRECEEYANWRLNVIQRDHYRCQCCYNYGKLNVHHIYSFSNYESIRTNINNGITLCKDCHDVTVKGSLHNMYGTLNVTPQQLEEYINNKRKELGITDPFYVNKYIDKIDPLLIQKSA